MHEHCAEEHCSVSLLLDGSSIQSFLSPNTLRIILPLSEKLWHILMEPISFMEINGLEFCIKSAMVSKFGENIVVLMITNRAHLLPIDDSTCVVFIKCRSISTSVLNHCFTEDDSNSLSALTDQQAQDSNSDTVSTYNEQSSLICQTETLMQIAKERLLLMSTEQAIENKTYTTTRCSNSPSPPILTREADTPPPPPSPSPSPPPPPLPPSLTNIHFLSDILIENPISRKRLKPLEVIFRPKREKDDDCYQVDLDYTQPTDRQKSKFLTFQTLNSNIKAFDCIFSYLSLKDRLNCHLVSKTWKRLISTSDCWNNLIVHQSEEREWQTFCSISRQPKPFMSKVEHLHVYLDQLPVDRIQARNKEFSVNSFIRKLKYLPNLKTLSIVQRVDQTKINAQKKLMRDFPLELGKLTWCLEIFDNVISLCSIPKEETWKRDLLRLYHKNGNQSIKIEIVFRQVIE